LSGHDSLSGLLVERRLAMGVRLVNVAYAPGTVRVRTDCPDLQLWWVVKGGWTLHKAGLEEELAGGRVSVHAPREPCHQKVAPGGATLLSVQIPATYAPAPSVHNPHGLGVALARLQTQLWQESLTDQEPLALEELVAGLFASVPERATPHWLVEVREQLHGRFHEPLRLADLAAHANVHEVHLAATFRARYGCTLGEYLRRLRLDAALRQLSASDDEIATIAQAAGFYDQAHFTKLFRARVGVPPHTFRQKLRSTS
jgi:AraC-like DNA-binding protein